MKKATIVALALLTLSFSGMSTILLNVGESHATSSPIIATISVGIHPFEMAYDPSNKALYVTHSEFAGGLGYSGENFVTVIDTTSNSVVKQIKVGADPMGVAYDPNNGKVYTTILVDQASGSGRVVEIDGATNTVTANISLSTFASGITYVPATGFLYVSHATSGDIDIVDPGSRKVVGTITTSLTCGAFGVAYDSQNRHLFASSTTCSNIVSEIDTGIKSEVKTYAVGVITSRSLAYDSFTDSVYGGQLVSTGELVFSIRASSGRVESHPPVSDNYTLVGFAFDPAHRNIYASAVGLRVAGAIYVLSDTTDAVVSKIPFGSPSGIAYDPDNGYVYVADSGAGTVSAISTSSSGSTTTSTVSSTGNSITTSSSSASTTSNVSSSATSTTTTTSSLCNSKQNDLNTVFDWSLRTLLNKGVGQVLSLPKWANLGTGVFLSVITKQPVGIPPNVMLYGSSGQGSLSRPFLRYMLVSTGSALYWQTRFSIGDVVGRPTFSVFKINIPAGLYPNPTDTLYSVEQPNPNNAQGYFTDPCLLYAIPSESVSFSFTQPGLYMVKASYGSQSDMFGTDVWYVMAYGQPVSSGTFIMLSEQSHKLLLSVYDSQGRHVGFNSSTGAVDVSIPGAQYADLNNTTIITLPSTDGFRYVVDASSSKNSTENYSIAVATYRNGQVAGQSAGNYTISQGSRVEQSVQISPDGSQITVQPAAQSGGYYLPYIIVAGVAVAAVVGLVLMRKRRSP